VIEPDRLVPRAAAGGSARAGADLFPVPRLEGLARSGRLAPFGVPLSLDVSWLFGLGLSTWTFADAVLPLEAPDRPTAVYVAVGALTALLVFLSLALHEVGHWIAARRAGLPIARVALSLVGGILELGAPPRSALSELRLALGGPVASLLTAAIAALAHVALVEAGIDPLLAMVAAIVAVANLAIMALNLLPGLPLDGGRIVRAVAWSITGDAARATRLASAAGRVLGVALLVLAVIASASGDAAAALWSGALGLTIHHHA
jgi:Zn-dependent protease